MTTRRGGFLHDVDQFDPQFFGMSPREAETLDPQQRLLLEVAWETLEHAGQDPQQLAGTDVGVFVGISNGDYGRLQSRLLGLTAIDLHSGTGTLNSVAAGRVAYFLGLTGPTMAIDTACSSSLVAIHLAARSLRAGECRAALVGGVNLMLDPSATVALSAMRALSPDGSCKTFDAAAERLRTRRGLRLRDAQAAFRRHRRRGSCDCRGAWFGGQSRRAQQRLDRAAWPRAGSVDSGRSRGRGREAGGRLVCRGARNGHLARRSDRSPVAGCGLRTAPRRPAAPGGRIGEDEHRAPGTVGGNRGPDQGRLGAANTASSRRSSTSRRPIRTFPGNTLRSRSRRN